MVIEGLRAIVVSAWRENGVNGLTDTVMIFLRYSAPIINDFDTL